MTVKLRAAFANFVNIMTVGTRAPAAMDQSLNPTTDAGSGTGEIGIPQLRQRVEDYLVTHYLVLHITVVSVALAMAGVSAASLITRHDATSGDLVLLWLLWLGSLFATAVAYGGTMVGAFALPSAVPSVSDLALPLLMSVDEFLLFSILISQVTSTASLSTLVGIWLALMAGFGGLALLSIARAKSHFVAAVRSKTPTRSGIYSTDASAVINTYITYLSRDQIGAGATCTVAAIGALLKWSGFRAEQLDYIAASIIILLLAQGLRGHGQTERMWRSSLQILNQA